MLLVSPSVFAPIVSVRCLLMLTLRPPSYISRHDAILRPTICIGAVSDLNRVFIEARGCNI